MRPAVIAASLMVLAGGGHQAQAASPTPAEWLREACADSDLYYSHGACAGYLRAVLDRAPDLGRPVCPEEEPDLFTGLGVDVADMVGTLQTVPGESAEGLALRALEAAYPCAE